MECFCLIKGLTRRRGLINYVSVTSVLEMGRETTISSALKLFDMLSYIFPPLIGTCGLMRPLVLHISTATFPDCVTMVGPVYLLDCGA